MRLSISNKTLKQKPCTQKEKSGYFKGLKFKTKDLSNESIKDIIDTGYTITYLYDNNEFDRRNHYMSNNYKGTQFICVDIDKSDISPTEFIEHVKYKPSVLHTTFSNLTEKKDNRYCFHLLYFFDEIIYGEDNFHKVFSLLTEDYIKYVDKQAMDCHRLMFSSNSSLNNYEYYDYGIIYRVNDFIRREDNDWDKISAADIYNNSKNNISEKTDLSRQVYCSTSSFTLDKEFYQNMSLLSITVKPMKRSFKIDKNYWIERGMDNWLSITNHIRKQIRSNDFEELYDCSLTIEQNITEFKSLWGNNYPKDS